MDRRRFFRLVALTGVIGALAAVLLASLGPGERPSADAATSCALPRGKTVRVAVAVPGQGPRSALVHIPPGNRRFMPLVLALHGAHHDAAFMERYSGLSRLGDGAGFGVVYADAGRPRWHIAASEDSGDVQFIDTLLDRVLGGGCFDARRVSAVGVSNGGGMAARFACAGDDRLAGLVAVAGDYAPLPPCRAHRPLSVLEIHGTADTVVPYAGTPTAPGSAVANWLRGWASRDACSPAPGRAVVRPRVLELQWRACDAGTSVEHLRLVGGTHAWPGADPPDPGPQLGVSASGRAWAFLKGKRLSRAVPQNDRR
jgi:polyhydroxybutyrate depolymerase